MFPDYGYDVFAIDFDDIFSRVFTANRTYGNPTDWARRIDVVNGYDAGPPDAKLRYKVISVDAAQEVIRYQWGFFLRTSVVWNAQRNDLNALWSLYFWSYLRSSQSIADLALSQRKDRRETVIALDGSKHRKRI